MNSDYPNSFKTPNDTKLSVTLSLVSRPGSELHVFLTPSFDSELPMHLYAREEVCLIFSKKSCADFVADRSGVAGTLSFRGHEYRCFVPWKDVHSVANLKEAKVELFDGHAPPHQPTHDRPMTSFPTKAVPYLRPIEGGMSGRGPFFRRSSAKKGHLRVV